MGCPPYNALGSGAQAMIDAAMTAAGAGWPVYYRVSNFVSQDSTEFEELGFQQTASVAGPTTGYTDIQILPQPKVKNVSMFAIGQSMGSLNNSSRTFTLSNTFVKQIMSKYPELTDPEDVFDGFSRFMGLVYDGTLYAVKNYQHTEIGGQTIKWRLTCNAVKNQVPSST